MQQDGAGIERRVAIRYVTPLREGGSLPAIVETDGGAAYVVKFRGAGQGAKALVAEHLAAGLAGVLGLPVPRAAVVRLGSGFGRAEPDPEIQDVLRGSVGENFGLAYLAGALPFDPSIDRDLAPELAADVVWFDALITNVDRTVKNTNLLLWRGRLWMIDHGAALYVHHRWEGWEARVDAPFPQIKDHVLLPFSGDLAAADARLRPRLTDGVLRAIVADLPDAWLGGEALFADLDAHRAAYVAYLRGRLDGPRRWLDAAIEARGRGPEPLRLRETHRVGDDP
jgi:hypothetical protein